MKRLLVLAVVLAAGLVLTACGHASLPRVEPDVAGRPTWGGCSERTTQIIDYASGARGERSLRAALAPYRVDGDHVVRRPAHAHRGARWLLVDDRQVIHTSLELLHAERGWLVDVIEKCSA